jgi:hypothetical protein
MYRMPQLGPSTHRIRAVSVFSTSEICGSSAAQAV